MIKTLVYLTFCLANAFPYILVIRPKIVESYHNDLITLGVDLALQIPFFLGIRKIDPMLDKVLIYLKISKNGNDSIQKGQS